MSQTVTGDNEGARGASLPLNKHFQSTTQTQIKFQSNHLPIDNQNGFQCTMLPHPTRPANPSMVGDFRLPVPQATSNIHVGTVQYPHHHQYFEQQQHHIQHMNVVAVENGNQKTVLEPNMPNRCNTFQYIPGNNYLTTVAVHPRDHLHQQYIHQNQLGHSSQVFLPNQEKYLMNPTMINPVNNMNYMQNVMVPGYKNGSFPVNFPSNFPVNSNPNCPSGGHCINNNESNLKYGVNINNNTTTNFSGDTSADIPKSSTDSYNVENSCNSDPCHRHQSIKTTNSNCNSPIPKNASGNNANSNRPRSSSSRETDRSETAESSCSSLSTESAIEQCHLQHHSNNNFQNSFTGNYLFPSGQSQNVNTVNNTNGNYPGFGGCQSRVSAGQSKQHPHCNQNLMQTFRQVNTVHQLHMQSGQVQIMQQQYQYVQGQGMGLSNRTRPAGPGMFPNCVNQVPNSSYPVNTVVSPSGSESTTASVEQPSPNQDLNSTFQNVSPMPNFCAMNAHPAGQFQPIFMGDPSSVVPMGMTNNGFISRLPPPQSVNSTPKGHFPPVVVVPFGWKRINEGGQIVYTSPSGNELRNVHEVTQYLTQEGTCKCGLQCPLRVESTFSFDPKLPHRLTMPHEVSEMSKLCNHRRKLAVAFSHHLQNQAKKEDGRKKRKRKAAADDGDISPLQTPIVPQHHALPFIANMHQQQQLQQIRPHFQNYHHPSQVVGHHPSMPTPPNWNPGNCIPRMVIPPNCQNELPKTNYNPNLCNSQYQSQSGSCCENHMCYPGNQSMHCSMPHGNKTFEDPEMQQQQICQTQPVEPICRGPPIPDQNFTHQQNQMQYFKQHQTMMNKCNTIGRNIRTSQQFMPVCHTRCNHTNIDENTNGSPMQFNSSPLPLVQEPVVEVVDKKPKGSNRSRKRAKTVATDVTAKTSNTPSITSISSNSSSLENSEVSINSLSENNHIPQGPSFMEDPNGYLAQQTALLNNTMAGGGVGQFSPQAPTRSNKTTTVPAASAIKRSSLFPINKASNSSPVVVPLPSNVPLPARVSKASSLPSVDTVVSTSAATSCTVTCTSVQSNSSSTTSSVSVSNVMLATNSNISPKDKEIDATASSTLEKGRGSQSKQPEELVIDAPNSNVVTTTCESGSNSPQSLEENSVISKTFVTSPQSSISNSITITTYKKKSSNNSTSSSTSSYDVTQSKSKTTSSKSTSLMQEYNINKDSSDNDVMSLEAAANKPLTPGPADPCLNTQSPLEMVQNIVSSIPVPASEELSPPTQGRPLSSQQGQHLVPEQIQQTFQHTVPPHQVINPHVFNMSGANGMTGVMYNPGNTASNMIRGPAPLVVHGAGQSGTMPQSVLVNTSTNNMVVVTSPFNSKSTVTTPVVCSNITGVVGVQALPHVQVQPSMGHVQSHPIQPQLQQIQSVQPVVQLVNTFAAMQGPVIIQNGGNLIQQPSAGVISNHGSVIGTAGIIPSSGSAFVTNQPLLSAATFAVDSSQSSNLPVVSSVSGDVSDDSLSGNRLTPIATPATTPTTPQTTPGSTQGPETPPSAGSSGGSSNSSGNKRKRKRRNASTPQTLQQHHQQGLVPTFIMGKHLHQPMVMNGAQIAPYNNVAGSQVTAVATSNAQLLQPPSQTPGAINVVQMVGGPVAGPLPVHVQQPPTILFPSAAPSGLIINQLSDGTFVSTDPNTGVSYPVQIQLSGSHIVGVTPTSNANHSTGVIGPITPTAPTGTMVAVNAARSTTSQPNTLVTAATKVINISPNIQSSGNAEVYDVSSNHIVNQTSVGPPSDIASAALSNAHSLPSQQNANEATLQCPILVSTANTTVVQQKTTIVAQQTTLMATGMGGTHSSVSTQTPGGFGDSDVTSSDSISNPTAPSRGLPTSPTHQSAEITTTKQDEDSVSPPLPTTPIQDSKNILSGSTGVIRTGLGASEEPHSATHTEGCTTGIVVVWASHRGYPQWPAQLLHQAGGNVLVRWYGDHAIETIPLPSISQFKREGIKEARRRSRGRDALEKAIAEAKEDLLLQQEQNSLSSGSFLNQNQAPAAPFLSQTSGGSYLFPSTTHLTIVNPQNNTFTEPTTTKSRKRKRAS